MNNNSESPRGTSAHSPDLSWSQVRETVLMLELAAAQIAAAMRDSNASVDILTQSFTTMVGHLRDISHGVAALADTPESRNSRDKLIGASAEASGLVSQAIVAFQFYDRLAQRLAHVEHSLALLSELVGDSRRLFSPPEWVELQASIRAKYTTPEEIAMFSAVMRGIPVQEAVNQYLAEIKQKGDDIEIF